MSKTASKIEIRTSSDHAGQIVDGVWQPGGQLLYTVYVVGSPSEGAEIAKVLGALDESKAAVVGRLEIEEVEP